MMKGKKKKEQEHVGRSATTGQFDKKKHIELIPDTPENVAIRKKMVKKP